MAWPGNDLNAHVNKIRNDEYDRRLCAAETEEERRAIERAQIMWDEQALLPAELPRLPQWPPVAPARRPQAQVMLAARAPARGEQPGNQPPPVAPPPPPRAQVVFAPGAQRRPYAPMVVLAPPAVPRAEQRRQQRPPVAPRRGQIEGAKKRRQA
eukprot:scpid101887/ scgid25313/ 